MRTRPTEALKSKPRAVIFDWDNTLADSWSAILSAMNAALRAYDMREWEMEHLKRQARLSMRDTFPHIFGLENWEDARDRFYEAFSLTHLSELHALEGSASLLHHLSDRGMLVSVVSNKQGAFLRDEVSHLGWFNTFHKVVGAGDASKDKPDPAPIALALEGSEILPGPDVWFVGDAYVDIAIADNAGLTSILIHPDPDGTDEFESHTPNAHFADLPAFTSFLADNLL